jgi:hypothetical protein
LKQLFQSLDDGNTFVEDIPLPKIEKNYVVELISLKNLQDDEDFLKQMNILYEECIKKEPEGYLWMHRRFKSGLTNSIYPKLVRRERKRAIKRAKRN